MNNALDNLEYMNAELVEKNNALEVQLEIVKEELRSLKKQALFERDCDGEPVLEIITVNGWGGRVFHDLQNTFCFEIHNADGDYVESEGGFDSQERAVNIVTDLLHLYSEFNPETIAPLAPEDRVIYLKAWTFHVETEMDSELIVPAESYSEAQDRLYEIYDKMRIRFDNPRVFFQGAVHNIKSAHLYAPVIKEQASIDAHTVDALKRVLNNPLHKKTLDSLGDE